MEAKASINNVRVTARKARLVADLIRNKKVIDAVNILKTTNKKSSPILLRLLNSAISNATNNFQMNGDLLFIKTILVNEGPTLKRIRPRAKGRAYQILKRSSNFLILLSDEINGGKK